MGNTTLLKGIPTDILPKIVPSSDPTDPETWAYLSSLVLVCKQGRNIYSAVKRKHLTEMGDMILGHYMQLNIYRDYYIELKPKRECVVSQFRGEGFMSVKDDIACTWTVAISSKYNENHETLKKRHYGRMQKKQDLFKAPEMLHFYVCFSVGFDGNKLRTEINCQEKHLVWFDYVTDMEDWKLQIAESYKRNRNVKICGAPDDFVLEQIGNSACCHSLVSALVEKIWNATPEVKQFSSDKKQQISTKISSELALQCARESMTESEVSIAIAWRLSQCISL